MEKIIKISQKELISILELHSAIHVELQPNAHLELERVENDEGDIIGLPRVLFFKVISK